MAQVKKYQVGGKLTKNGETLVGQDAIKWLADAFDGKDASLRHAQKVGEKAIANGSTFNINADGSWNVINSDGVDVTNNYLDRGDASTKDSRFKRFLDATANNLFGSNDRYNQRESSSILANARISQPSSSTATGGDVVPSNRLKRASGWFKNNEEGKYDDGNIDNQVLWSNINNVMDYLGGGKYDLTDWVDYGDDRSALQTWYNNNPDAAKAAISGIRTKLNNGEELDSNDVALLQKFGMAKTATQTAQDNADAEKRDRNNKLAAIGITSDQDFYDLSEDGKTATLSDAFYKAMGLNGAGNYWLNDYWTAPQGMEKYRGKYIINGRLYNSTDPAVKAYLDSANFAELNKAGNYAGSNKVINWMHGQQLSPYNRGSKRYISPFFNNGDLYYNGLNYATEYTRFNGNPLEAGQKVISYYTGADIDPLTGTPIRNRYAILDSYNNLVQDNLDASAFSELNGTEAFDPFIREEGVKEGDWNYNRYKMPLRVGDREDLQADAWVDVNGKDVVLDLSSYMTHNKSKNGAKRTLTMPLFQEFMDQRVMEKLSESDKKTAADKLFKKIGKGGSREGVKKEIAELLGDDGKPLSMELVDALIGAENATPKQQYTGTGDEPGSNRSGYAPSRTKKGAKGMLLDVRKTNGVTGAGNGITYNDGGMNVNESAPIQSVGDYKTALSVSDRAQLNSLALDLASLGASFAGPVGSMVGAGLSLAAAEEDIRARKRRGESLGQALLIGGGLGLANAAASFVAPAKVGAVTAKLVKWLPRAVEAGLVAGPSLAAAQNIIAGKGTINDFKLLSGAISMGGKAGIKRGRSAQAKSQIKEAIKEGELQVNKPSEAAATATGSVAARPTPVFKGKLQQGENFVDKDFTVSEAVREQAKLPNVKAEDMIKAVKEDLKAQGAVIDDTTTAAKLLDAIGYKATKNGGIEAVKAPKAPKVDSPKVSIFKKWLPKNWNRLKDEDILAVLNDEVQSDALVELTMGENPAINPRALAQFISQHQNEAAVKNFLKRHPMENASTTTAGRLFTYKYKFASDGKAAAARTAAETAQKAVEETAKTAEETTKKAVETPKIETPAPKVEIPAPKVEVETPKVEVETPRTPEAPKLPSLREIISKKSENAFPGIKAPVAVAAPQAPNVPVAVMSPYSRPAASATTTAFHLGESSPAASRAYRAPKTVVIENQAQLTDGSGKYTPALWVSPDGNVTITRAEAPKSPVKKTGVKAVEKKPLPKKEAPKEAPKEKKVNPKKAAKAAGKAASAEKNAKGKGKKMREYKDGGTLIAKYAGGGTNVTGLNYDPISLKSWLNKESLNNAARRGAEYQHKAADAALYADVTPTVNAGRMMAESAITPYKQAALNTRAKIGSTMTADSRLNRAMDINYEKAATGYDVQSNAALSNAKDRYAAAVNQAEQKNDALQAEAANKLLARQAQVSASHSEIDAGLNQQIAGNNHAWRQQQLQKASDIKAKLNELEMNKATQEEYVRQMDLVANAAKEARNAYDQWVAAYKAQGLNPAEKYADFDAWYEKSPDAEPYKNVGKAAKAQAQMVGLDTAINRYRNDLNRASIIPWHKNGGSTSTYRHKQPMETMAENAHKANLKAVEGFNRQIFRMLNDLLKV